MSRIHHPYRPKNEPIMFKISWLRYWHTVCISMFLSGCFFWPPFEEIHPNEPPVIEFSGPEANDVFRIDTSQGGIAWVSVYDPDDGDVMEYLWTINGLGPQGTATSFVSGNYQGSSITLPQEPRCVLIFANPNQYSICSHPGSIHDPRWDIMW